MGRKSPEDNLSKLLTFQGQSHHLFPSLLVVGWMCVLIIFYLVLVIPTKEYCPIKLCFKTEYSKTCLKRSLKNRQNKGLIGKWQLNEGRKYCLGAFSNTFDLH